MFILPCWQNEEKWLLSDIVAGKEKQGGRMCFDQDQTTHRWQHVDCFHSPPACWQVFSWWRSELQHSWPHVAPQLPLWAAAAGPHSPGKQLPPDKKHKHMTHAYNMEHSAMKVYQLMFYTDVNRHLALSALRQFPRKLQVPGSHFLLENGSDVVINVSRIKNI